MEVEAVTRALHRTASSWDSRITHTMVIPNSPSLLQKAEREAPTAMCQFLTSPFENGGCTDQNNMPLVSLHQLQTSVSKVAITDH